MARTRGSKNAPKSSSNPVKSTAAEATAAASSTAAKVQLEPDSTNPPKCFVLPKETSPDARITLIENPKTAELGRYLCCPEKGFYEFTRVGPPKTTPRSWLIAPSEESPTDSESKNGNAYGSDFKASQGYVTKSSDLFVATPIDPLFLVLPSLANGKKLFLASDDYLDTLSTNSPHFRPLLRIESIRQRLEARIASVCDTVDAGDEKMYRFNSDKLFQELLGKAEKMAEKGLPASMEEKFVRKALEVPVLSIPIPEEDKTQSNGSQIDTDSQATSSGVIESQTTIVSTTSFADSTVTTITAASTATSFAETPLQPLSTPSDIPHLLRLRTSFDFLLSSYVPCDLVNPLKDSLSKSTKHAFTDLENHLKQLAEIRRKVMESRSLLNDYTRKRGLEDDEMSEIKAEKKRKLEEEEKRRKAGESRGVRELKKVNVSGMKKMSDFFKKKV